MESSPPQNTFNTPGPITAWRKILGPTTTLDNGGDIVRNPFEVPALVSAMFEVHQAGGRLMELARTEANLLIWPLFTQPTGSCVFQLWGFDAGTAGPVQIGPAGSQEYLGTPYDFSLADPSGLLTAAAETGDRQRTLRLSFADNCQPWFESGATLYYSGAIQTFPFRGMRALMATLRQIGGLIAGEVVLLAKPV